MPVRRALCERAVRVHELGELLVEVVAEPDGHAGAGIQAEDFPGAPQGLKTDQGLSVGPPLGAPAGVGAAGLAAESGEEPAFHPGHGVREHSSGGVWVLSEVAVSFSWAAVASFPW